LDKAGILSGDGILTSAARGATTNVITQGISLATGLQSRFDWAGVAVAGVMSGVTSEMGDLFHAQRLGQGGVNTLGNATRNLGAGLIGAMAGAATRSAIDGTDFGDALEAAIPDVIGQTIGNMAAGRIQTANSQASANDHGGRGGRSSGASSSYGYDDGANHSGLPEIASVTMADIQPLGVGDLASPLNLKTVNPILASAPQGDVLPDIVVLASQQKRDNDGFRSGRISAGGAYDGTRQQYLQDVANLKAATQQAAAGTFNFFRQGTLENAPITGDYLLAKDFVEKPGWANGIGVVAGAVSPFAGRWAKGLIKDVAEKIGQEVRAVEEVRPSWRQSALDVEKQYDGEGLKPQVSFKDGAEVPYGTKGSSRPELYGNGKSVEVKNYNVETAQGRDRLVRNVTNQVESRATNLPAGATQRIHIDVRGQNVSRSDLNTMIDRIVQKSDGSVRASDIEILRW